MKIGMIGLGKMGANMAQRLIKGGHEVVGYSRVSSAVLEASKLGVSGAESITELIDLLPSPKIIWMMVPSGKSTDEAFNSVIPHLKSGDIVIDGGNTYYKDSVKRAAELLPKGSSFGGCGYQRRCLGLD